MLKAWIENNTVRDISPNPEAAFTPEIAAKYDTEVPAGTKPGAKMVEGTWVNPVIAPPAPTPPPEPEPISVTPIQFKLLWTIQERLALKQLRATDPIIDDFWELLDDPRLETLRLDLKSTQDGIAYCLSKLVETAGITEAEAATRAAQISAGTEV